MKTKVKNLFGKLKSKTAGNSGSSSSEPATAAVAADDEDARDFVNIINALASGTVTGDEPIEQLAGTVGKVMFTTSVSIKGVEDFWVAPSDKNRVRFSNMKHMLADPKHKIPQALAVRVTAADALATRKTTDNNLESIAFRRGQYKELDLADRLPEASCLFIFTTQLSGCTFAIGCQGTRLYMGHAQPHKDNEYAKDGLALAASLNEKRQTMFESVENLESTFLISRGSEFEIDESDGTIMYNAVGGYADVFGLVCNHKIYFILSIRRGLHEVIHAVLITQETGTSRWIPREMQKTW